MPNVTGVLCGCHDSGAKVRGSPVYVVRTVLCHESSWAFSRSIRTLCEHTFE